MSLNINTQTIRRLRDALLESGRLDEQPGDINNETKTDDRSQALMNRVSPFAETMYLTMMADGVAAESEKEAIRGALQVLTQGFLDESMLEKILERCQRLAREQGVEFRLQTLGAQLCADRQDRETAFTLAAAVAMADNQVVDEETSLVDSIAEWYGVSAKRCSEILQQIENQS